MGRTLIHTDCCAGTADCNATFQTKLHVQVLQQVYKNEQNIDDELVNSIVWPAQGNNAAEVFYRIITGEGTPVNVLLNELDKVERTQPFFIPARRFAHQVGVAFVPHTL